MPLTTETATSFKPLSELINWLNHHSKPMSAIDMSKSYLIFPFVTITENNFIGSIDYSSITSYYPVVAGFQQDKLLSFKNACENDYQNVNYCLVEVPRKLIGQLMLISTINFRHIVTGKRSKYEQARYNNLRIPGYNGSLKHDSYYKPIVDALNSAKILNELASLHLPKNISKLTFENTPLVHNLTNEFNTDLFNIDTVLKTFIAMQSLLNSKGDITCP